MKIEEVDCLHSVVDPGKNGVNKHRYVCAINEDDVRSSMRNGIQVVPLLYIRRSVLIMEPASSTTTKARSRDEKAKFTAELKSSGGKRKRQQEDTDDDDNGGAKEKAEGTKPEKKKAYGRKEPNPLSVKKKKRENVPQRDLKKQTKTTEATGPEEAEPNSGLPGESAGDASGRKRRRKHKSKTATTTEQDGDVPMDTSAADVYRPVYFR